MSRWSKLSLVWNRWLAHPGCLVRGAVLTAGALLVTGAVTGCRTGSSTPHYTNVAGAPKGSPAAPATAAGAAVVGPAVPAESLVLHEGDVVRITFPGAPNLNTAQPIRRDGRIALPLGDEFKASGLTPVQLQKALLDKYAPQLVVKEVTVTVDSSSYPIYVTGAVMRSGKMVYDRPVSALEAVMEAGVDYAKANLKSVAITRLENGRSMHYEINLKRVLQGKSAEVFPLKPSDIVYVPERMTWF